MLSKEILETVEKDVASLEGGGYNQSHRVNRRESLVEYYNNPVICKNCNVVLKIEIGEKINAVRRKEFCDRSCSASFNNKKRKNIQEILNKEHILSNIKEATNIKQLCMNLGYADYNWEASVKIQEVLPNINELLYENVFINSKTKGQLYEDCKDWQSARSIITKHAQRVFKKSDKVKQCVFCNYDKTYHVAHIKPVKDFDDNATIREINHIDNLIALCPNHHWEFDNYLIEL